MEISLLQAFALGIIAFIAGTDMFNGNPYAPPGGSRPVGRAGTWRSAYRYFNRRYAELVWMGWPRWRAHSRLT